MALSLAPAHLKRYAEVGRLFLKFARGPLASELRSDLVHDAGAADAEEGKPEELARDLEAMGPTFIKLGQLLSSRADLLPGPYLEALSRLQDDVAPFSFGQVEEIVVAELGVRLSAAFSEFEATPLAAASLGQVHRARLRDGRPVAVKVQRPGIRERIVEDLATLRELAAFLDKHSAVAAQYGLEALVDSFGRALMGELDYRREAQNLTRLHRNLERFESLEVPAADRGLHDRARPHDGPPRRKKGHGARPPDADGHRRRGPRRRALPRLPAPGRRGRLLPRGPPRRERPPDRGRAARPSRPRHGRPRGAQNA